MYTNQNNFTLSFSTLKMTNKKTFALLLFWFFFIFAFSYLIPDFSNNYRYMMVEGEDRLIASFYDIVVSQYRHYFSWGGRTPPHVLASSLLYLGKGVTAFATAACYLILVYLIFKISCIEKQVFTKHFNKILFITTMLWICTRNYGEVFFMTVTACNYFFTTTFILFLCTYFAKGFVSNENFKKQNFSKALLPLFFILGVIAGWCNENTGFAICFASFLAMVHFYLHKKLNTVHLCLFLGFCAGFLILVLSPGNHVRLENMEKGSFDYFEHIFTAMEIFLLSLLENSLLLIAMAYLFYLSVKHKIIYKYKEQYLQALYLFIVGFASLAIMIFSPNFPARSSTPFTFFSIATVLCLYNIVNKEEIKVMSPVKQKVLYGLALLYFAITASNAYGALFTIRDDCKQRDVQIQKMISEGQKDLVVEPFRVQTSRYIFVADVRQDPKYFANQILTRYYHLNSIRRSCDYKKSKYPATDLHLIQEYGKKVCESSK